MFAWLIEKDSIYVYDWHILFFMMIEFPEQMKFSVKNIVVALNER